MDDALDLRRRLQAAVGADLAVGERIGQGGFGVVYAAHDIRLGRAVAIKALRQDLFGTPEIRTRFESEARTVAALRHPHIIPLYHVGEADGIAYMVMPRIDGPSLRTVLETEGRLPVSEVTRIGRELAEALHAAHQRGILHRDVKPENVMLDGPEHRALLMDFGIARSPSPPDGGITGTGVAVGSPRYMSPEQARAADDVDARSDLYALGVVCYELLTGRRPFTSESLPDLVFRQATTAPPDVAHLRPECAGELADAVMSCLEVEPSKRPGSAAEFAATLATLSRVSASTLWDTLTARSWLDRRLPATLLVAFAAYATALMLPVPDMSNAMRATADGPALALPIQPLIGLIALAIPLGLLALLADLLITRYRLRQAAVPRAVIPRLLFGQPRWWGTWYPRAVRAPDSVWSRLAPSARLANLAAWIVLVSGVGLIPWLLIGSPTAASLAAGGVPLPLPTRLLIAAAELFSLSLKGGLLLLAGTLLLWRVRDRVRVIDALRSQVTLSASTWEGSSARAMLRDP